MNKSAPSLQWGRNFIVAEMETRIRRTFQFFIRFNGAATLSLRKLVISFWIFTTRITASMGPQLYRCGNIRMAHQQQIPIYASMGPQLYRCGNIPEEDKLSDLVAASMGPQLYRCGNLLDFLSNFWYLKASMGPQLYRCGNMDFESVQYIESADRKSVV